MGKSSKSIADYNPTGIAKKILSERTNSFLPSTADFKSSHYIHMKIYS